MTMINTGRWSQTMAALELESATWLTERVEQMSDAVANHELLTLDDLRMLAQATELITLIGVARATDGDVGFLETLRAAAEMKGLVVAFVVAKGLAPMTLLTGQDTAAA